MPGQTSPSAEPPTGERPSEGTPICFVTEDGSTVSIMLDPAQAHANPAEALIKAKDVVRCLADAFGRAERRVSLRPDEAGAVFRSWAYRS
ncbi:hypothetical protein [Aquibium microcysteis]|uniref:hypothetical protein n=1 Tax=Aquibium microcysteis TaxID=675281 RepID=UPI00165D208C|nr:hypothetical protein [Aquibium microcysteis]